MLQANIPQNDSSGGQKAFCPPTTRCGGSLKPPSPEMGLKGPFSFVRLTVSRAGGMAAPGTPFSLLLPGSEHDRGEQELG